MKKINLSLVLFLLIAFSVSDFAQFNRSTAKVGTTVAQFLKIGAGARAIGMGGAYTAIANDIYGVYWNPAGVVNTPANGQAAFNHVNWLADISYDFAAASLNVEEVGTFFITMISLGVPEDKVRTEDYPEGDGRMWDAKSLAIGVGFARKLTDKFSVGVHLKYIREGVWNNSASGMAVDIGTFYVTPFNDLVIGASISNFGTKMQLDGRDILFNYDPNNDPNSGPNNVLSKFEMGKYDLPLTFRLGLAMDVYKDRYFRTTAALDATHPNDNTEYVNTGVEFAYDEMFMFRLGYKSLFLRDSEQGLTLGGGLKYQITDQFGLMLNYGWADYGRLKNVQFFDLGLMF